MKDIGNKNVTVCILDFVSIVAVQCWSKLKIVIFLL